MSDNDSNMDKAVVYIRVSTDEQAKNNLSLDSQLKECFAFADREGYEVVRTFREEGASAKTTQRPQLLAMLDYCTKNRGKLKYLIVWKLDRFARNAEDHMVLKAALKKVGVSLLSVTELIADDPSGRFMETVLAATAQFDNEVRGQRATHGMVGRIEEGSWPFVAPVGYRNHRDPLNRPTLEPDEKAPAIQKWLRLYLTGGYSQRDMWKLAWEMGITNKSGKKLSNSYVCMMLRNPLYAGLVQSRMTEGIHLGLHEGLISPAEYEAIQDLLAGRKHKVSSRGHDREAWPLRGGFVRCAICSTPITGSEPKGRSKHYPKYACPKCRRYETGKKVSEDRDELHTQFVELLEKVKPAEDKLALFREITLRQWNQEYKDAAVERKAIDRKLDDNSERRQKILDLLIQGALTPDEKAEQIAKLDAEKVKLELARNEARVSEVNTEALIEYAINFMANVSKQWVDASPADKQRFQNIIFPEGLTYDFGVGFGTAKLGLTYEVIGQIDTNKSTLVGPAGFEPATKRL